MSIAAQWNHKGTVELAFVERAGTRDRDLQLESGGEGDGILHEERATSQLSMMRRSQQVTANVEEVADESVHGQESLRLPWRFEPSHVSLALPVGLVRDFGAIVRVSVRAMGDGRHDRSVRSPVAAQFVGGQLPRRTLLALQQLAKKRVAAWPSRCDWTRISRTSPS